MLHQKGSLSLWKKEEEEEEAQYLLELWSLKCESACNKFKRYASNDEDGLVDNQVLFSF